MNIRIENSHDVSMDQKPFELVERKGIGHPDTLIDGIVESFSVRLCREYLKDVGKIMHHNVDKGQICGGSTIVEYGGGRFIKPIHVILSGRATDLVNSTEVPIEAIGLKSAKDFLKKHCRNLDVDEDVVFDSHVSSGSKDLVNVFLRGPEVPLSNDTSFGIGYAPLSDTEKIVLAAERLLNSKKYQEKHPFVGEDVKVMGVREENRISLTVATAFVSKYVSGIEQYQESKEQIVQDLLEDSKRHTMRNVDIAVNTGDDCKSESIYMTLTGLSCEMGDDGSVGRGNRANGLITPCRPMTLEAAAGKNPVNHVGKIYSVLAFEIAADIVKKHDAVKECEVKLLSQIGMPIDKPKSADVSLIMNDKEKLEDHEREVSETVDAWLGNIPAVTEKIVEGRAGVYY